MLCVVAHPDDECFAFGGALALAALEGVETHVVCMTDGQAASNRGDSISDEELGRMRREEFAASCAVLGVTQHELMDYQDGQLENVDFLMAAGRLVQKIRSFLPHVVLTFGLDGGLNTHPDHVMVSALTSAAFHWAASKKRFVALGDAHRAERLFYVSTSYFMEDRPAPMPAPWSVALDVRSVMQQKQLAFSQHTSQKPLMEKTRAMFEQHGHTEHYTLAASQTPAPVAVTDSLFAGLSE